MKRLFAIALLGLYVAIPVSGGEVPFPPKAPPSCTTEPCPQASTTSPIPGVVVDLVLMLISRR